MTYTELEKQQIKELREEFRGVEKDTKESPWLLEKFKKRIIEGDSEDPILTGLRWARNHISTKRKWPTLQMIYDQVFKGRGMDKMTLKDMRAELRKNLPSHGFYEDTLHKAICDLICSSWGHRERERVGPIPRNASFSDSHPDRTDTFSWSFFIPTDPDGYEIIGFDKSDLSQEQGAINARKKYGNYGRHTDSSGDPVIRFTLPEVPDAHREMRDRKLERTRLRQERTVTKNQDDHGYIQDAILRKYYEKVVLKEELKEKERILNRDKKALKALVKTGEVSEEDYKAFSVSSQLRFFEKELKTRYLQKENPDALRRLQDRYRKWYAETSQPERTKVLR